MDVNVMLQYLSYLLIAIGVMAFSVTVITNHLFWEAECS